MRPEILTLCLIVGAFTYAFRVLPTRVDPGRIPATGALSRFLAATGPSAIATLFVVSFLSGASAEGAALFPALAGAVAVLVIFRASRSVVAATLAGSAAFGAVHLLI
jgi:branched-subunit amino acid transport protein